MHCMISSFSGEKIDREKNQNEADIESTEAPGCLAPQCFNSALQKEKKTAKNTHTHTHITLLKLKTRGDCCDAKIIVKTNTLNPSPECFFFVLSDGANGPGLAPLSKGKVLLLWGIRFILYSICKCEVVHSPDFGGS